MMWSYFDGSNWPWMVAMMLLFWGGIVAIAFFVIRAATATRHAGDPAIEILRKRLATGEISQDEFDRTKRALQ